jgi:large subunit ribosomal protein L10
MSKVIKQMEMDALRSTFKGVRDLVVLSVTKLDSQGEYTFRAALRKKNIHLKVVKNSLTRKVFREMNMQIADDSPFWQKPTMMAWGGSSVADLSKEVEAELKHAKHGPMYKDRVVVKGAIADGEAVSFEDALKRPTKEQAIGRVINLALSPAQRIVGQILGPGANVVGQIKSIKEKEGAEAPAAPAAS